MLRIKTLTVSTCLVAMACGGQTDESATDSAEALRGGAPLVKQTVTTDPLAVCNDGSPAIYYVRPGARSDRWVIHLKGGGGCSSWEECNTRRRDLVSSLPWEDTLDKGGILDPHEVDNPAFFDWNHVFIPYCSSDTWSGDAAKLCDAIADPDCPRDPRERWHHGVTMQHRGRRIVDAVISELRNTHCSAPDLDDARFVIFSGSSAGASGMRKNIDRVADTLRSTNPNVQVRGVNDSAFSVSPLASYQSGQCTMFLGVPHQGYEFWGHPEPDATCVAGATAQGHSPGECMRLEYALGCNPQGEGYIETPFFVFMDQTDQLTMRNRGLDPQDPSDKAMFRAAQRQLFTWAQGRTAVDWASQGIVDGFGLLASDVGRHTAVTNTSAFSGRDRRFLFEGNSYHDLLVNWLRGTTPTTCVEGVQVAGSECW